MYLIAGSIDHSQRYFLTLMFVAPALTFALPLSLWECCFSKKAICRVVSSCDQLLTDASKNSKNIKRINGRCSTKLLQIPQWAIKAGSNSLYKLIF